MSRCIYDPNPHAPEECPAVNTPNIPEIGQPIVVGHEKYRIRAIVPEINALGLSHRVVLAPSIMTALTWDKRIGLWRVPDTAIAEEVPQL